MSRMSALARNDTKSDNGYILVTVACFLIVMLAVVALAVDIGVSYSMRTQNQAAADAAALAGAYTFIQGKPQPASAINEATVVATMNKTHGAAILAGDVTVTPNISDPLRPRVTVDITRTEPTFFAKVIGFNSVQVHTTAIAEAFLQAASSSRCEKPVFIPNYLGTIPACGPMGACMTGQVLIDSAGNKTAYATSIIGHQFVLKPQSPDGALNPSDFYEINFGGGGGGSPEFEQAFGGCNDVAEVHCQDSYEVLTGNRVGPTIDGVNLLIGDPPEDAYHAPGQYEHPAGSGPPYYDDSRALVSAPIVDLCGYMGFCPTGGLPRGGNPVLRVVGFAKIFVESVGKNGANRGDVVARFIDASPCGPGAPTTNGSTTGGGLPLRLVRAP
jgi:Putative Flp pilus-assembly TadE/G-like